MRPVAPGPQPAAYAPAQTFKFTGHNAVVMKARFGTASPTLAQCLELWQYVVRESAGEIARDPDHAAIVQANAAVKTRIEAEYKKASVPLTDALGEFCSYCETRIQGLMEVEHVASKSQYPTHACAWTNFLLACGPCNTAKADTPTRTTVQGWMHAWHATPTDDQQVAEIHSNRYLWPSFSPDGFRQMPHTLCWWDATASQWIALANTANEGANFNHTLDSFDISTRTVRATLYLGGPAPRVNVPVVVRVRDAGQPRAAEMGDLVGLNVVTNLNSTYDRRMMNRTRAWFTVLQSLRTANALATQTAFDAFWPVLIDTARVTGFYSVWVTILVKYQDPSGVNLGKRFVHDTNTALYFPNTNTAQVP